MPQFEVPSPKQAPVMTERMMYQMLGSLSDLVQTFSIWLSSGLNQFLKRRYYSIITYIYYSVK